jgi:alanine racemase
MDHTMIDVTAINLLVGDEVTLISSDPAQPNSIASLQEKQHLYSYVTLTGLSSSVRREIV